MAIQFLVALAALLLEHQHFVTLYVSHDGAFDGNVQLRSTDAEGAVVIGQQGVAKLYRVTDITG